MGLKKEAEKVAIKLHCWFEKKWEEPMNGDDIDDAVMAFREALRIISGDKEVRRAVVSQQG